MILGYCYKLRPNVGQSNKIDRWIDMLRANYNWSLADRIDSYYQRYICGDYCDLRTKVIITPLTCSLGGATGNPWSNKGKKKSPVNIQITELPLLKKARPWYDEIDSTVLQQNLRRLDNAYNNFFQQNRRFPKFKNRSTFRSFTYATGVKIKGNKIYLPKLGWTKFYNSRPIPDGFKIKSVTVRKKSNGYYVSVRIEHKSVPDFPLKNIEEVKTVIGLDMGLGKLVYCSDSSAIDNPRFATNKTTKRLQKIRQRRVSRKKKGSNNRRKSQQKLSGFQYRIAIKREAYQWQTAKKIVQKSDAIAIEDLQISNMIKGCKPKYDENTGRFLKNGQSAKRALNRLIADASWYSLTQKIEYMAAKSGKIVLRVNPRHTSQECSVCHHIDPDNRKGEKFFCTNCGHVDDANFQASINIKNKAINHYSLNIVKKVRRDLPEPKQLTLFQTPTSELTENKRRKHYARKSKRDVPGNLSEYTLQLSLFNQENNHPDRDSL
ncbi:transposase [Crocosphaera sp.]|uniref:RNA-guided endonuclease InsQ/TnpB family protein n=1 Tax=Crocosphaera sp. TaxID=2729996 RepID=UPI00262B5807|nr:transposase [Crocosphaera sp.]MDJ0582103.1 transposase [Crocosphaera sp.]